MEKVFKKFHELFTERYAKQSVLQMGEDTVRYDFFRAVLDELKIENWEMNVEFPVVDNAYVSNLNEKSKRKESPVIDLLINSENEKSIYEFGFFRKNSVDNSSINVTEKTFKMFNDFLRLALQKFYTTDGKNAYFICVADEKIIGSKYTKIREIEEFPAVEYNLNSELLLEIKNIYKSSKEINEKFLNALLKENGIDSINAKLIFKAELNSCPELGNLNAKILIYKITNNLKS